MSTSSELRHLGRVQAAADAVGVDISEQLAPAMKVKDALQKARRGDRDRAALARDVAFKAAREPERLDKALADASKEWAAETARLELLPAVRESLERALVAAIPGAVDDALSALQPAAAAAGKRASAALAAAPGVDLFDSGAVLAAGASAAWTDLREALGVLTAIAAAHPRVEEPGRHEAEVAVAELFDLPESLDALPSVLGVTLTRAQSAATLGGSYAFGPQAPRHSAPEAIVNALREGWPVVVADSDALEDRLDRIDSTLTVGAGALRMRLA